MKKTSNRILFFGNERLATGVNTNLPVILALIEHGYDIAAIVSNYTNGKSRNARDLEIKRVAQAHNIPLLLPIKLTDIRDQIIGYSAGAAVLVAYGKIVPQEIIDLFPKGIINIHPSLLPNHRGPTPIESTILNGDFKTGVSIMKLAKNMDAGPIFDQLEFKLSGMESKQDLADNLLKLGKSLILKLLPGILDGSVVPVKQDETGASYDKLITKADGLIDWKKTAIQLEREIRAYLRWPGSHTHIASKEVIITKAHVVDQKVSGTHQTEVGTISILEGKVLAIQTGEKMLAIDKLTPIGKKEMSAQSFMAGYRIN